MFASCCCFQSHDALCSSPQDAHALGTNQGCAAEEKILILSFPSTACLVGHPGFELMSMSDFLGFERANRRTKLSSSWSNILLSFLPHVVHWGVANSCSLPLELGQHLTAKAHCHQLYGQTLVKVKRTPWFLQVSQTFRLALRCRLQT